MKLLITSVCNSLLFVASLCQTALAWNKPTHMVTGAIAYQELQLSSPATLNRVVSILKQHPDYKNLWASRLSDPTLTENDRDQYLLMMAARWADDVRGTASDRPSWHFINYVYAPAQGIARTDTTLATGQNILQAFEANRQVVRSNAPDSIKAVAICWLFHLTGDVHMPLHTAALVNPKFPQGDKGGNLFKIRLALSSQSTNLHSFWDNQLLESDAYASVNNLAEEIRRVVNRQQLPQLGRPDIGSWSKESFQLAQDNAYRSNTLQPGTETEGTVLPPDYVASVKPVARRQVALAGYRLADELASDLSK